VTIFNKRNALIGYVTVKAISRKRRRIMPGGRKRNGWKVPVFVGLGIVSAGVLAVLLALMLRRQREPEHIEGFVVAGEPERFDAGQAEQQEPSEAA
jgi:hypothetical protein